MKKIVVATVVAIALSCLLLCTPALANYNYDGFPVETRACGNVNGGVFIDYVPWDGTTNLTLTTKVPNGTVKWARLYVGVWGGTEGDEGWVNVTFNGVYDGNGLGPIHLQGKNDNNSNVWCSGHGKHWMYYTVTNLTTAGSTNVANYSVINGTLDTTYGGRCYGIVLVVVYEGGDNPKNIQYWINDGSDGLHAGPWPPEHDPGTTDFDGTVDIANVTRANLTMVHLTAYDPTCSNCLRFNDNSLNTSMVDSNTFELNSWDVTGYVASSGNNAWYNRSEDGSVSITNAILVLEREQPDFFDTRSPGNPYPSIPGTHNGTLEVYKDMTISKMYTYPCAGTGGHTESVKIWNGTTENCAEAHWDGYKGDYHNIPFNITLKKGVVYNYIIRTGSYPQIHHREELPADGGIIRCAKFTDVNGKEYDNLIPAIKLY
ncbi:hypothetical protein C5S30_00835 [ANME-1 cluster archaeon GoMg4]|nr:hypothetical protein [ANME-1 cluster archaeon GoMg4]